MGADAFIAFYGIKYQLSDDEVEACERRTDERMRRAHKAKLDCAFARATDGEPYFLYVGSSLANLGVEASSYERLRDSELAATLSETRSKLTAAGFKELPDLYFQLIAQY